MKKIHFLLVLFIFAACKNSEEQSEKRQISEGKQVEIFHATGFEIERFEDYSIIEVKSPWPNAEKSFRYLLAEEDATIPEGVEYDQKVEIPVEKVVVTSTTHIPALEALQEEKTLKGFPGLDFISSVRMRELINEEKVKELGNNENINTEILIDLEPDVVIGFSIDANNKTFETIQKTGIPVVYNGDWTEETPLGKAEWIKFFGAFYNKNEEANIIFEQISAAYSEAKELAQTAKEQPKVIAGSMYKDQWYMPYGNSWQAKFIEDANAAYAYTETEGNGSMGLSFESVLAKHQDADFWVSAGQFTSYEQLFSASEHYRQFKAVQDKNVYSVSLVKGETGGVVYFELGPQRPDLVLKDLISIFHPDLLPEYERTFYKALADSGLQQ
ncbi:ABC transporter substrate-binding protein [Zunongwangia sp. F225]|uniref:ABC transporter substrate-binding protein n=1 Tax=Autumnicola psychrophila TaxID=3075592 RepID=A0ABU3DSK9_9FLAO|nr:ABC transporter substrate-binding protein [Zunongwangia sp. F225]MDT0686704.1 ABC transporter substrate-binding protein [Zunongwangia sp. F225]